MPQPREGMPQPRDHHSTVAPSAHTGLYVLSPLNMAFTNVIAGKIIWIYIRKRHKDGENVFITVRPILKNSLGNIASRLHRNCKCNPY